MKNIIIAYISKLSPKPAELEYRADRSFCGEDTISGIQTNEAGIKCILGHLKLINEDVGSIICLVSEKVMCEKHSIGGGDMSTYDFFKGRISGYYSSLFGRPLPEKTFVTVRTEGRENGAIISEIGKKVSASPCSVYFDTTGGRRDSVMIVQLLTKFLEYSGIEPVSVYSDINGNEKVIKVCDELYVNMRLLDAVNEFAVSGRSDQLCGMLGDTAEKNSAVKELLGYMEDFTNSLQMCSTERIDEIIENLGEAVEKVEQMPETAGDDIKLIMLKMMLPIIREKFFGDSGDSNGSNDSNGYYDYCRMVKWCVNNGLIQQALTIYTEMIPKYIFDEQLVEYTEEAEKKARDTMSQAKSNFYAVMFHDIFMECVDTESTAAAKRLMKAVTEKYSNGRAAEYSEKEKAVIDALDVIKRESEGKKDFKEYIDGKLNRNSFTDEGRTILKYAYASSIKSFGALVNRIRNDPRICKRLLGCDDVKTDTLSKKIYCIDNLSEYSGGDFIIKTDMAKMQQIMYGYLYIKAVRNHINHASDEDFTAEHYSRFTSLGYSAKFDSKNVKNDILKALQAFDM